uniref:Uncharacterized protein n=1 Tax=Tanacetum cinerariifolium TaxID=118510 RepID=A0A6L2NEU5_TANCI|nr:hypothetical protein [Tanacetum cinerariifolium]
MPQFLQLEQFHTQPAQQLAYAAKLTGQASYVARIMPDTVLSDRCEKFYRQPGNVASTGGYSSKDFEKEKQPNCLPSLMFEKSLIGNIDVHSLVSLVYKKQTAMNFHNFKLHMASVKEELSSMHAFNGFHFDPHVAY